MHRIDDALPARDLDAGEVRDALDVHLPENDTLLACNKEQGRDLSLPGTSAFIIGSKRPPASKVQRVSFRGRTKNQGDPDVRFWDATRVCSTADMVRKAGWQLWGRKLTVRFQRPPCDSCPTVPDQLRTPTLGSSTAVINETIASKILSHQEDAFLLGPDRHASIRS